MCFENIPHPIFFRIFSGARYGREDGGDRGEGVACRGVPGDGDHGCGSGARRTGGGIVQSGSRRKKVCVEMAVGECMATMGKSFFEKRTCQVKKKAYFCKISKFCKP